LLGRADGQVVGHTSGHVPRGGGCLLPSTPPGCSLIGRPCCSLVGCHCLQRSCWPRHARSRLHCTAGSHGWIPPQHLAPWLLAHQAPVVTSPTCLTLQGPSWVCEPLVLERKRHPAGIWVRRQKGATGQQAGDSSSRQGPRRAVEGDKQPGQLETWAADSCTTAVAP